MSKIFRRLLRRSPLLSTAFSMRKVGGGLAPRLRAFGRMRTAEEMQALACRSIWSPQPG